MIAIMPLQMNHDGRRLWHSVGYGHVDWTDWYLPETIIQRDFITMGPDSQTDRLPLDSKPLPKTMLIDLSASEAAVGNFVQKYSSGFAPEAQPGSSDASIANEVCVLVTRASGSLTAPRRLFLQGSGGEVGNLPQPNERCGL